MLNTKKLITKMLQCDFVIEEGTSGDWYYRKWNSGRLELHCVFAATFAMSTSSGALYSTSGVNIKALPSAMAKTIDYANCMVYATGIIGVVTGFSETDINYRPLANSSRTSTLYNIGIEAKGTWK